MTNIKYFTDKVNYYFFDVFKLYYFELTISPQDKNSARASTYWHGLEDGAGMITVCYSKSWIKSATKQEMDKVAFHEVWEAILSEMQELVKARFIAEKDLPAAVHRIIRRMENVVFPLVKTNGEITC